ncbi:copper chaperone PCu(A)C [Kitasatospora sp. NPDC002227]|uniref:copper chaperone PCu(A)C n=1 Tax=Kitasatospora sp. NPDC002227 TaxID=3154773 RepID=UPI00331E3E1B
MNAFRRSALIGAGLAAALTAGVFVVGCGSDGATDTKASELSISGSYIPLPATPGGMGAGYLTVTNNGGGDDQLVKVSSPAAKSVTMHRSTGSTMEQADSLPVPAHGALKLERGGNHLMIMGWSKDPAVGDRLELDLTFAKGATITVQVPVQPLTYRPGS